jgi:ABC-type glycerol-3-phosphate transport system permease component
MVLNAVLYFLLTVFAVIAMAPFVLMVSQSLMTGRDVVTKQAVPSVLREPSRESLDAAISNYYYAWEEASFSEYFRNSVAVSLITIVGTVLFSVLAAYAFALLEFPGKNLLFFMFLATIMIPDTVLLIPNFMIVRYLDQQAWFGLEWFNNWPALTIPFFASAFSIFLLRQFFAQIPRDLWDAAQIDGAGHVQYMMQVVIPLSVAPILTVVLFTFIQSWNALAWPILVASSRNPGGTFLGIPWESWRPITAGLQAFVDEAGANQQWMMAASVIAMAPVLILYFLFQKQFIENLSRTGIKG